MAVNGIEVGDYVKLTDKVTEEDLGNFGITEAEYILSDNLIFIVTHITREAFGLIPVSTFSGKNPPRIRDWVYYHHWVEKVEESVITNNLIIPNRVYNVRKFINFFPQGSTSPKIQQIIACVQSGTDKFLAYIIIKSNTAHNNSSRRLFLSEPFYAMTSDEIVSELLKYESRYKKIK